MFVDTRLSSKSVMALPLSPLFSTDLCITPIRTGCISKGRFTGGRFAPYPPPKPTPERVEEDHDIDVRTIDLLPWAHGLPYLRSENATLFDNTCGDLQGPVRICVQPDLFSILPPYAAFPGPYPQYSEEGNVYALADHVFAQIGRAHV